MRFSTKKRLCSLVWIKVLVCLSLPHPSTQTFVQLSHLLNRMSIALQATLPVQTFPYCALGVPYGFEHFLVQCKALARKHCIACPF